MEVTWAVTVFLTSQVITTAINLISNYFKFLWPATRGLLLLKLTVNNDSNVIWQFNTKFPWNEARCHLRLITRRLSTTFWVVSVDIYCTILRHSGCPPVLPFNGSKSRKCWRYRGITLHCNLLYLCGKANACVMVISNSAGAVTGSSCISNPLTPTISWSESLTEQETKIWRAVVVVDIQQPYYIRIRSEDPSCEVSLCRTWN